MSNPIFIFEGLRNATLIADAGSATGYPTAQLQDDRYDTLWRSASAAQNQVVSAQFAIAKSVDSLYVANHNLESLGLASLDVETSINGTDWVQALSLTSFPDPLYSEIGLISRAYARVKFVKSSALSVAPQMGLLYIGARSDMPLYLNQPESGLQGDAIVDESMSGLKYSSSLREDREAWKINMSSLSALQLYNWARLVRGVNGTQYPFWFCDMNGNWHFVRFKKNYLPWIGKGNVRFPVNGVEFEEERVGIAINLPGGYTVSSS